MDAVGLFSRSRVLPTTNVQRGFHDTPSPCSPITAGRIQVWSTPLKIKMPLYLMNTRRRTAVVTYAEDIDDEDCDSVDEGNDSDSDQRPRKRSKRVGIFAGWGVKKGATNTHTTGHAGSTRKGRGNDEEYEYKEERMSSEEEEGDEDVDEGEGEGEEDEERAGSDADDDDDRGPRKPQVVTFRPQKGGGSRPVSSRPLCQFGEKCYRKNLLHLQQYAHPHLEEQRRTMHPANDGANSTSFADLLKKANVALFDDPIVSTSSFHLPPISAELLDNVITPGIFRGCRVFFYSDDEAEEQNAATLSVSLARDIIAFDGDVSAGFEPGKTSHIVVYASARSVHSVGVEERATAVYQAVAGGIKEDINGVDLVSASWVTDSVKLLRRQKEQGYTP